MSVIGINVVETDGTAAPAIAGAPISVTGLVLRSRRGPTGGAVRVSRFTQFADRFGAHDARFAGAYCVEGFFANGGSEAWVTRVVGSGAAAARVTLKDRRGTDTLRVGAGFRGAEESGAWGNDLYVSVQDNPAFSTLLAATLAGDTPARLEGGALAPPLDLRRAAGAAADRRLALDVDDPAERFTITFDATTLPDPAQASVEDVADAINAVAGARVVASADGDALAIVSRAKGAASKVVAVGGVDDNTRTLLGLAAANTAAGAAGANPYTEARVESAAGFAAGVWARLDDGLGQDWVKITSVEERDVGGGTFEHWVHFDAPAASDRNEYRREDAATLSTTEFDLRVARQGATDVQPVAVEAWEKVSLDPAHPRYAPNLINDGFAGSASIVVSDLAAGAFTGRDAPAVGTGFRLGISTPTTTALTRQLGNDGGDPSTGDYRKAFANFDTVLIQLLAVPEVLSDGMLDAVTGAGVDYCANKGDCMFVGHTPAQRDVAAAKGFGQRFQGAKVYGALYWPWISVSDPIGPGPNPVRTIPPTGHVLGVYARTAQTRFVWKAPAGEQAVLRGALDVERDVTDVDHTDLVKNGSVNGIRRLPGAGIVVDASRTLSTDTRWLYVNVRLLFNYVKASLRDGLRWAKQEPNREDLWNRIKFGSVTPFLLRLYQDGAFGAGTPAEVFTVICGPENNPPASVVLGNLQVEVYFYPSRPAETILIIVGQQDSGATASER
jgi:hypothetical protein